MKLKSIDVTLSRTVNLGNYESAKAQIGLFADLDETDDVNDSYDEVRNIVLEQLDFSIEEVISQKS